MKRFKLKKEPEKKYQIMLFGKQPKYVTFAEFMRFTMDYIRFGKKGMLVTNKYNNRSITRITEKFDTEPMCKLEENGNYVKDAIVWEAIDFLNMDGETMDIYFGFNINTVKDNFHDAFEKFESIY